MIEALKDNDGILRCGAAFALEMIGKEAKAAVPALIEALKDNDGILRCGAASALGSMEVKAKVAVTPLIEALKGLKDENIISSQLKKSRIWW